MTVEQFAYLRAPDKIRAALINAGGPRLSVDAIERKLRELPRGIIRPDPGKPRVGDGEDFRVAGLVRVTKPIPPRVRNRQVKRLAELASGIQNRPQPARTFRYRAPRTDHASTAHAERLIDVVCDGLGIPRDALLSHGRMKLLVAARSLIVALLRERSPEVYSYPRIASILKRMDHSTMIYSHQQFGHYCDLFPVVADLYAELREGGE